MQLNERFKQVRFGAALTLAGLAVGVGMGVAFGIFEDSFKSYIAEGLTQFPAVHDAASKDKIWRYAQRAHFHATGVAGFSIGLIVLIMFSSLRQPLKSVAATLVGLGSLYPLAWLNMFFMAPSIGREPAHHHIVTEILTYIGVGGLVIGMLLVFANLFLDLWAEDADSEQLHANVKLVVDVAVRAANHANPTADIRKDVRLMGQLPATTA